MRKTVAREARTALQDLCTRLRADNLHLRAKLEILTGHAASQSCCSDVPSNLQVKSLVASEVGTQTQNDGKRRSRCSACKVNKALLRKDLCAECLAERQVEKDLEYMDVEVVTAPVEVEEDAGVQDDVPLVEASHSSAGEEEID